MIKYPMSEDGWNWVDKKKLTDLIEDAFSSDGCERKLVDDFFDAVDPKYVVIAEEDERYVGAAIVQEAIGEDGYLGFDYVNKLAVSKDKRNNGVAKNLMEKIHQNSKAYVLRADLQNEYAIPFYDRLANASNGKCLYTPKDPVSDKWKVYFNIGVVTDRLTDKAVEYALKQPVSLLKK